MFIPDYEYTPGERTVCEILARLSDVRRMLSVSAGGAHPHWWGMIGQANGVTSELLELTQERGEVGDPPREDGNSSNARGAGATWQACRDAMRRFGDPFDAVLWWHGPERLEKAEAIDIIGTLWGLTRGTLIVGCIMVDDAERGAPTYAQRSLWRTQDFRLSGFHTECVRKGSGQPHITAWRYRVESLRYDLEQRTVERLYYAGDVPPIPFPNEMTKDK